MLVPRVFFQEREAGAASRRTPTEILADSYNTGESLHDGVHERGCSGVSNFLRFTFLDLCSLRSVLLAINRYKISAYLTIINVRQYRLFDSLILVI